MYQGGASAGWAEQEQKEQESTHSSTHVSSSLVIFHLCTQVHTSTYVICKATALCRSHIQNLCKMGKPDNPDTQDQEEHFQNRGSSHVLPSSPACTLVLQQELQLLQGQPHAQLLLSHQIQDLLQLVREVLHGVHVQHLCPGTILKCFVEHTFASVFVS